MMLFGGLACIALIGICAVHVLAFFMLDSHLTNIGNRIREIAESVDEAKLSVKRISEIIDRMLKEPTDGE